VQSETPLPFEPVMQITVSEIRFAAITETAGQGTFREIIPGTAGMGGIISQILPHPT
jgi:hypothetical protein